MDMQLPRIDWFVDRLHKARAADAKAIKDARGGT